MKKIDLNQFKNIYCEATKENYLKLSKDIRFNTKNLNEKISGWYGLNIDINGEENSVWFYSKEAMLRQFDLTEIDLSSEKIKIVKDKIKVGKVVTFKPIFEKELIKGQQKIFEVVYIDDNGNCFGKDRDKEYGHKSYLEVWEAKRGELCWFYNSKKKQKAILSKYKCRDTFFTKHNFISMDSNKIYDYCEPYIQGKLPKPFRKEKNVS